MTRFIGAHQVFTRRNEDGSFALILAKTTDDFLEAGTRKAVTEFFGQMKQRFTVGKEIIEDRVKFNGCVIDIGRDSYLTLSMQE